MTTTPEEATGQIETIHTRLQEIRQELARVIVGQEAIINKLLIALLARGHCLLVGVPGLAKTLIIKSLGEILGLSFSRIQFTPDLMPADITGSEVLEEDRSTGGKTFRFIKGPVFANIVLADEINRTPPKTQSALLEAMQEYNVTISGTSYDIESPFFVLATQNPIEQEGTYPLPEAQLDRFMFSLWLDYPSFEEEVEIVERTTTGHLPSLTPILSRQEILSFQEIIRNVAVTRPTMEYAVRLTAATRGDSPESDETLRKWIRWGAGPRAAQNMILAAKVHAVMHNRLVPGREDIDAVAEAVLRHRIVTTFAADAEGIRIGDILEHIHKKFRD
ncbi:MAG: MoxR family ATPase [Calditrichaeota bacterium]|nr:MAG: MoxR family ATPase [Calditrichota bacterium]